MIAVLDYGIGNLRSAQKALEHLGADALLVDDPDLAGQASGIVLPGVGSFGRCMAALRSTGMDEIVIRAIETGTPFLGICVGLQMLFEHSEESPGVTGLGVLQGSVIALPKGVKHPQMQWNLVRAVHQNAAQHGAGYGASCVPDHEPSVAMFAESKEELGWYYFVHSFAPELTCDVIAVCDYGGPVTAAVQRGPLWGTQFHPEKSGLPGLNLLRRFIEFCKRSGDSGL
ncbi:MAG: imidazole glycerol phosphate synthase subunit HisH [Actinobacteria bacterium]|nr:imidazole glycerol phosphate synthase subunit HisH [Actinomycetota bacterium]